MAEDSLVLDWQRDRSPMQPDGGPVFLEPISDELRELIIRRVLHAARQHGIALPMLWYWPRGLKPSGTCPTTRTATIRPRLKHCWK